MTIRTRGVRSMVYLRACCLCMVAVSVATAVPLAAAQDPPSRADTLSAARKSEFRVPLASILVPGTGQYVHGAYLAGLAHSATAAAGYLAARATSSDLGLEGLPREGRDQLAYEAVHTSVTSGFISAWDAFHRAVPALREEGKYEFLTKRESVGDLLSAPFETDFLGRWTTWLNLAYTGVVAGVLLSGRDPGIEYEPFRARDAAFAASLSLNAGVGEEALFRGWLLPLLHQRFGERFWLANSTQGLIFGALHPQAGAFAAVIAAWGVYEGWLTRRNDWSVRESIFHHFWYDLVISAAGFLTDEREARIRLTLPTIRF